MKTASVQPTSHDGTLKDGQKILCTITATSDDGVQDAKFRKVVPSELLPYGIRPKMWEPLMEEANTSLEFKWNDRMHWWALMCFLPFFFNQHNADITQRGTQMVLEWNAEKKLPMGIEARFITEQVKTKHLASGPRKGVESETHHGIQFIATSA